MSPVAKPRAKANVAPGAAPDQTLAELERRGRAALARMTDQEVEAIIWVVIQTIREVEQKHRTKRTASRRKVAGPGVSGPRVATPAAVERRPSRARN